MDVRGREGDKKEGKRKQDVQAVPGVYIYIYIVYVYIYIHQLLQSDLLKVPK